MTNRFFDLSFVTLNSGAIRLTQSVFDEDHIIDAHPEQILFVARALCGFNPENFQNVSDLERRLAVLTDKLQAIVCNDAFRGDLLDRCGDGFEYLAKLDAIVDLALEFDGGRLEPDGHSAPKKAIIPERFKPMSPPPQNGNDQGQLKLD